MLHEALAAWMDGRGQSVLELLTGQSLIVKRS